MRAHVFEATGKSGGQLWFTGSSGRACRRLPDCSRWKAIVGPATLRTGCLRHRSTKQFNSGRDIAAQGHHDMFSLKLSMPEAPRATLYDVCRMNRQARPR